MNLMVTVGQESDDGEIRSDPIVAEIDVEVDGGGQWQVNRLEFAELTDNRGVLERLTGIFAGGGIGAQAFFGDREVEIERRVGKGRGRGIEAQFEGTRMAVGTGNRSEEQSCDGMRGGGADLLTCVGSAAADKLNAPVDDHLRRVDTTAREGVGIVVLTNGEVVGRIGIPPAEMVPVIDMLFERDDLDAVEGLLVAELLQEQIGGRTTRATFGSEKFDDNGLFLRDVAGGRGGEGPACGDEQNRRNSGE